MTYFLIILGVGAFCLVLLIGLIVAARQRPTRHDQTLEHIKELEKGLGIGESDEQNDTEGTTPTPKQIEAERPTLTPEQSEADRAHIRRSDDGM